MGDETGLQMWIVEREPKLTNDSTNKLRIGINEKETCPFNAFNTNEL